MRFIPQWPLIDFSGLRVASFTYLSLIFYLKGRITHLSGTDICYLVLHSLMLSTATLQSRCRHWPVYHNVVEDTSIAGVIGIGGRRGVAELAKLDL